MKLSKGPESEFDRFEIYNVGMELYLYITLNLLFSSRNFFFLTI